MENMEKKEGRSKAVLSDVTIVASGVVQLMEKQERGLELPVAVNRMFSVA